MPDDEDGMVTHVISLRVSDKLYGRLVKDANEDYMLASEYVRTIIREFYSADEETGEEESKPKRRRKRSKHLFG